MKPYKKMTAQNTALIVIDVVNSCAHEKCEHPEWKVHFSKIRQMVPSLVEFIEEYRKKAGSLIIFTDIVPWNKEHLPFNINELYTDPKTYYYSHDTSGFSEEFYLVNPQRQDVVITKNIYDAFSNPELEKTLKEKGIQYLVMTGVFGDGCVLGTICSGFSKGFNFVILEDLIETTDDPVRQDLQKLLKKYTWPIMYGKTLNSQKFLENWKK